jgi:hypothetical protein
MSDSQYFENPETGEVFELITEPEYRNAGRDHRGSGSRPGIRPLGHRPPPNMGGIRPRSSDRPDIVRHSGDGGRSVPTRPSQSGEYVTIRKSALAEIIPSIGQVWASFLVRPETPQAVGDDVIDRDNAAMHRDALAQHQQNMTRALALTKLAARAVRLLLE